MACEEFLPYFPWWDDQLASKKPNYDELYQELLKTKESLSSSLVKKAILQRMAKVTYLMTQNVLDQNVIKEKAQEVLDYVENVLIQNEHDFDANLWLACYQYRLACIETDISRKINAFGLWQRHLALCAKLQQHDKTVIYLQSRLMHAELLLNAKLKSDYEECMGTQTLPVPVFDFVSTEPKLRKAIEENHNLMDYMTLAQLLIHNKLFVEANKVINSALTVPRLNEYDALLAEDIECLKDQLPTPLDNSNEPLSSNPISTLSSTGGTQVGNTPLASIAVRQDNVSGLILFLLVVIIIMIVIMAFKL